MLDDDYRRWIEPERAKSGIRYMLSKCLSVPANNLDDVQEKRGQQQKKTALIAAGAAVAFFVVVIGALSLFAEPVEGKKPEYGRLAVMIVLVVGGAGVGAFHVCGSNNQKRAARDAAFEELCQRVPTMRSARHTELVGDCVGTVPWFLSEEWIHAYGLAAGEYQGDGMIMVECTHVIDPILTTTDSKLMQGLSGMVSKKHQRLYLRAMEATVFIEPLENVPDLVFVPQTDANRAYYKRALKGQDCDLSEVFKLPRGLRSKYWMAAAAPEECGELFATNLPALLKQRKWCIVQVVGGHCVVMTSQWHGNRPSQAPKTEAALTENLEFARAIYQELKQLSDAAASAAQAPTATDQPTDVSTPRANTSPRSAPSTSATATARPTTQPTARPAARPAVTKRRGNRRPHSLLARLFLLGLGVPLLLFGALGTLGFWAALVQGRASLDWTPTEAVIFTSTIDSTDSGRFSSVVSYEYEVDGQKYKGGRIQYGLAERSRDKRKVERTLAKYPKGAQVQAYYNPKQYGKAVLVRGIKDESEVFGFMVFTVSLTIIGFLMSGYGVAGRKRKF